MRLVAMALVVALTGMGLAQPAGAIAPRSAGIEVPGSYHAVQSRSGRPRTQSVRGYTRRDGRSVAPYRRAPPRR